jgi:hypothetical protein
VSTPQNEVWLESWEVLTSIGSTWQYCPWCDKADVDDPSYKSLIAALRIQPPKPPKLPRRTINWGSSPPGRWSLAPSVCADPTTGEWHDLKTEHGGPVHGFRQERASPVLGAQGRRAHRLQAGRHLPRRFADGVRPNHHDLFALDQRGARTNRGPRSSLGERLRAHVGDSAGRGVGTRGRRMVVG